MDVFSTLMIVAFAIVSLLAACAGLATYVAYRMFTSIKPAAPEGRFLEEDLSKCQLFKYLPELKGKLAWLDLKNNYPTPVHKIDLPATEAGTSTPIYLKREDLSNDRYGGNKVRTMEFLMASAACQIKKDSWLHAFGGAGSNNCVIASLVGKMLGIKVNVMWGAPEAASYDNALNCLSVWSLAEKISPAAFEWFPWSILNYLKRMFFSDDLFLFLGGQSVLGALGHVSAIMEIAEDIERGAAPDPAYIVLPSGSGCTTSGILLGIALARTMGIGFKRPLEEFRLHPVFVLPEQKYIRPLIHWFTVMCSRKAAQLIKKLGGPDCLPELEKLSHCLELQTGYAGVYGGHNAKTLKAKELFKKAMESRKDIPSPWICSCFTGKSGSYLMDLMEKLDLEGMLEQRPIIFWQTKTAVQPYGDMEKVRNFAEKMPSGPRQYVLDGGIKDGEKDCFGEDRVQMHPLGGARKLDMSKPGLPLLSNPTLGLGRKA